MKVSILGNSLTSLSLAKTLINQGIRVDIFSDKKIKKYSKTQTLGISKANVDFFNEKIINIKNLLWGINNIKIYSENFANEEILDFKKDNSQLFSIIRNQDLYDCLFSKLCKDKLFNLKKKINYNRLMKSNYKLIFNCDHNNFISKKFFHKKIVKDYKSFAYVTSFKHEKLSNNYSAYQIFTKRGPFAFLPVSSTETSVVYSVRGKKDINFEDLIHKYNDKYKIVKIEKVFINELKSSNLRSYFHKNIIAFGDLLHRLHPLAGQGFNMTIRDLKQLNNLIEFKKEHGLDLDTSICLDFEKKTKKQNYLFSNGIDLIYELFNFESKFKNDKLSKSIKLIGKNKVLNNLFTRFADNGLVI